MQKALDKNLSSSHIWHAILHLNSSGQPQIDNNTFLLSYPNFTPQKELELTIKYYFEDKQAMCKYPARYYWLNQELNITDNIFTKNSCPDFDEYVTRTYPEKIKLVFVSEKVQDPSSMMGHTLFKLVDKDNNQHAVSYFTVIDTINIPYLILKSTLIGMKGYFILSPYQKVINRYLNDEERNIWEYDLALNDEQKNIIYYHFWELRNIDLKYLFTGFNCATIVNDMLSITKNNYNDTFNLWITPKDVIKQANKNNLITNSKLIPSSGWEINMFYDSMPKSEFNEIGSAISTKQFNALNAFLKAQNENSSQMDSMLALSYAKYLYNNNEDFSVNDLKTTKTITEKYHNADYNIDIQKYKNPIKTYNDTQLSIGYQTQTAKPNSGTYARVEFLPAATTLYDDNREYFSETSLKIANIAFLANTKKVILDKFDLYSMKSLSPWNSLTKSVSNEIRVNYEPQYDANLEQFYAYNISGGGGLSVNTSNDSLLYGLLSGGLAYGNNHIYPYLEPHIGFMLYEILNMKSVMECGYNFNQGASGKGYLQFSFGQSIFINKDFSVTAKVAVQNNKSATNNTTTIAINWFF